jgi:prepilin-type processing-associated H-X9-DG protein
MPAPTIQAISYLSPWSLMRAGPDGYSRAQTMPFTSVGGSAGWVAQSASWEMSLPTSYYPRHAKLGRESMKVFMADGFRFLVESEAKSGNGYADYDAAGFRNSKGIGNVDEPPSSSGSDFNKMYNIARRFAYRHGTKNAINALFFDGHALPLRVDYLRAANNSDPGSGFAGDAVHPKYYYPSGTVVNQAGYLHLPIPVGTKLP